MYNYYNEIFTKENETSTYTIEEINNFWINDVII